MTIERVIKECKNDVSVVVKKLHLEKHVKWM